MAAKSTIEWTDATWNVITGCWRVSEGCRHCYAERLAATRLRAHPSRRGLTDAKGKWTGEVRFNEQWLDQPLRWREPRRIFVCAHGDLFHEAVPGRWIADVFFVMGLADQHVFQILTKRPERMRDWMRRGLARDRLRWKWNRFAYEAVDEPEWPLPNVWLGTSVEDQATADRRIPALLETPAAVRFVSAEPLLGAVDLLDLPAASKPAPEASSHSPRTLCLRHLDALRGIIGWDGQACTPAEFPDETDLPALDWVIVGGESGPGARPMSSAWARSLRDQCGEAGVPFFFKQWGGSTAKAGGRLLDGRTWDGMPNGEVPRVR